MSLFQGRKSQSIDWITLTIYLALMLIGWLMLYAAVYDENNSGFTFTSTIGKQTIWFFIAIVSFIVVYSIDWKFWNTFAFPIYITCILMLLLVLVFGVEIKGARSWFSVAGLSFQPSEIAKFGTALAVSSYLGGYKMDIRNRKNFLIAVGLVLLPILLVLLQPDAGSAIIFLSFFILFYKKGLSPLYYILGFFVLFIFIGSLKYGPDVMTYVAGIIGLGVLIYEYGQTWRSAIGFLAIFLLSMLFYIRDMYWIALGGILFFMIIYGLLLFREQLLRSVTLVFPSVILASLLAYGSAFTFEKALEPHQQDRINVWLRPELSDPQGSRYNIIQSRLAIGSGGLEGKGFLEGDMTKLNYVPEQTTDFIFSTVGEEQGFIGSVGVVFLFIVLLFRIVIIAERSKSAFIHNFAYSVAGIIFLHFFINIGMAIGIMPVIGIPLPFLSKGGSSLLGFTILIAVLLKMDRARLR